MGEPRRSRPLDKPDHTHWVEYTDGTIKTFKADTEKAAFHYVKMEGDHVLDFGVIE